MIDILFQVINVACLCFTVIGASVLAHKGDKLIGWYIYVVAATLGFIYFIYLGDITQLGIWIFFLINDFIAIRRKKKEPPKKYIVCYEAPRALDDKWINKTTNIMEEQDLDNFAIPPPSESRNVKIYELVESKKELKPWKD